MNGTSIFFGLLIVLFTLLLLRWMQTETAVSGVSFTKDVPILWIDYVWI